MCCDHQQPHPARLHRRQGLCEDLGYQPAGQQEPHLPAGLPGENAWCRHLLQLEEETEESRAAWATGQSHIALGWLSSFGQAGNFSEPQFCLPPINGVDPHLEFVCDKCHGRLKGFEFEEWRSLAIVFEGRLCAWVARVLGAT